MRIAVHAKVLSEPQPTGIGVYTYNLLRALSRIDTRNQYTLFSNEPLVRKIEAANFTEKIFRAKKLWSYYRLPLEFVFNSYDILFVPKELVPPFIRPKTVVACFDLMGLLFADRVSFDGKVHFWIAVNYALKKADRIVAISEATKKDILKKCGLPDDRVQVTHLGYDEGLYRPNTDKAVEAEVKARYGVRGSYLINTSSVIWYRKNLHGLVRAFHACKLKGISSGQLVITGKRGEAYREVTGLVESLGLSRDVVFTGYVPDRDLPVLLSGADALVFPSLDEGFGLPILEAMACACPVVTSGVSAMPEVAGEAGLLVDPYNVDDIASAIGKVSTDPALRARMRERGLERARLFSWETTARKTLEVFEGLR